MNFKEEEVRVEYVLAEKTIRESVDGTLSVPGVKPDVQRVLELGVEGTTVDDIDIGEGGIFITGGILNMGVIYVADEAGQPVHFFSNDLNLDQRFIEIPELTPDKEISPQDIFIDIEVLDTDYSVSQAGDSIEVALTIAIHVRVKAEKYITLITDVLGIDDQLVKKELLRVDDIISKKEVQYWISDETLTLTDNVERILKIEGGLVTDANASVVPGGGAVKVTGKLKATVTYVGAETDQPVYMEEGTITFEKVIDIPEVEENMKPYADIEVKNWEYNVVNDTTINIDALLNIEVKVTVPREIMAVVDIKSDEVKVEKDFITLEEIVGENQVTDTIMEEFSLPQAEKPDIGEIVEVKGQLQELDCNVESGGAKITGDLVSTVIYRAAEENTVHSVSSDEATDVDQKINSFVSVPGAEPGMECYYNVLLQQVRATKQGDRRIKVTAISEFDLQITNKKEFNIVTEIIKVSPVVDQPDEEKPSKIVYVVQPGDTLYKIASRYNTTIDAIVGANDIDNPDYIDIGEKLIIPKNIINEPKG